MKLLKPFVLAVAFLVASLAVPAHAGVTKALKVAGSTVLDADFVASVTRDSGTGQVSLLFLANHPVWSITDKLSATVGVDVRAEFEFASQFSNLGIGGGLRYSLPGPFSAHVGYARTLVGLAPGASPDRLFVGIGLGRK